MKTTTKRLTLGSAVLAAALVCGVGVGCDKKSEPSKTNVPKPPAPDVTPKASAGGGMTASGAPAGTGVGANATTIAPATQASASGAKSGGATAAADDTAPLVTSTDSAKKSKEAQDLVGKAMQALKDNKFDDCKAALDKVDGMGDAVPKATREQATTVRHSLDAAQKLQKSPEIPTTEGPNK